MRRLLISLLALLALSACAAPAGVTEEGPAAPPPRDAPADPRAEEAPPDEAPVDETEDHVLLTLEAPLADGRILTLEAVGKVEDEHTCGVREVRVWDGEERLQTITAYEAIEWEWGSAAADLAGQYTDCWSPEETMEVLDLDFDGSTDFGLFGWRCNNTIPFYYWTWDSEAGQYRYAFTLQGAEVHPETRELTAEYKSGSAGSQWITRYYRPDGEGGLYLHRLERTTLEFQPESGELDIERGGALEIWIPPEGDGPVRLGPGGGMEAVGSRSYDTGDLEDHMVLVRREVPVIGGDGSRSTEIWESRDGAPRSVERKEYADENEP